MSNVISLMLAIMLLFSACATTGSSTASSGNPDAAREAQQAAMAALARMDGGGPLPSASQSRPPAQSGSAAPINTSQIRPIWVDNPDTVYNRQFYVSAVGLGADRTRAERDSLAKLTGIFGQTIQSDLQILTNYSEAVSGRGIQVTENTEIQEAIAISAEMDSLVGAEIADVWFDNRDTYYAVAVMERERTSILYADLIRSNERIISDLTNMTPAERNSLDGYSRFLLAATIADANRV